MRFRVRHAQQTIADHVEATLTALGWANDPGPWGAKPVRFQEVQPDELPDITPNLVSTLIEDAGADEAEEMGALVGGLMSVTYDLFVDVYGEKLSITWSIAEDIKDALSHRQIPLMDYTQQPAVEALGYIEFEDVRIVKPSGTVQSSDVKRNWRSVSAVTTLYFQYGMVSTVAPAIQSIMLVPDESDWDTWIASVVGVQPRGQGFAIAERGVIRGVAIYSHGSQTTPGFRVRIWQGAPTEGDLLLEETYEGGTFTDGQRVLIPITETEVQAGQVVVEVASTGAANFYIKASTGNYYPDGLAWIYTVSTDQWVSTGNYDIAMDLEGRV